MPGRSRSPPRQRAHYGDSPHVYSDDRRGPFGGDRKYPTDRRDGAYDRRRANDEDNSRRYNDREGGRSRDDGRRQGYQGRESSRREYDERDREKERERDRERYRQGAGRDRERSGPSRRSASPRARSSRPHSTRAASGPSPSPPPEDKAKPNFAPSGLLAAETNTVTAVDGSSTILKYNEPPEARKPILGWRLYVFKGSEQVELLHIHRQSAYLIGRDRLVADIPIDHPSCSKQHAVIQYRYLQQKDEFGGSKGMVKPFIIDLESTNGTHVNDEAIPVSRYYELKAGDVIKFGQSTREYVLLHDEAA